MPSKQQHRRSAGDGGPRPASGGGRGGSGGQSHRTGKMCRYGRDCRRSRCAFRHPSPPQSDAITITAGMSAMAVDAGGPTGTVPGGSAAGFHGATAGHAPQPQPPSGLPPADWLSASTSASRAGAVPQIPAVSAMQANQNTNHQDPLFLYGDLNQPRCQHHQPMQQNMQPVLQAYHSQQAYPSPHTHVSYQPYQPYQPVQQPAPAPAPASYSAYSAQVDLENLLLTTLGLDQASIDGGASASASPVATGAYNNSAATTDASGSIGEIGTGPASAAGGTPRNAKSELLMASLGVNVATGNGNGNEKDGEDTYQTYHTAPTCTTTSTANGASREILVEGDTTYETAVTSTSFSTTGVSLPMPVPVPVPGGQSRNAGRSSSSTYVNDINIGGEKTEMRSENKNKKKDNKKKKKKKNGSGSDGVRDGQKQIGPVQGDIGSGSSRSRSESASGKSSSSNIGNSNACTLLSPETLKEARESADRLLELSRAAAESNAEEFNASLQMCRSVQSAVVEALERAMMMEEGIVGEAALTDLLMLNEVLLGAIGTAEASPGDGGAVAAGISPTNASQETDDEVLSVSGAAAGGGKEMEQQPVWSTTEGLSTQAPPVLVVQRQEGQKEEEPPKKSKKKRIRKKKKKGAANGIANEPKADADLDAKYGKQIPDEAKVKAKAIAASQKKDEEMAKAAQRVKLEEKERLARLREEARKQQAAAREKKKQKKVKKYERLVAEKEKETAERAQFWIDSIAREKEYTDIIVEICIAEFVRQNKTKVMGLTAERVKQEAGALESIAGVCQRAYRELYKHVIVRRVIVADHENKDLNSRNGTILHFDTSRGAFSVALDTATGKQDDCRYVKPENLKVAVDGQRGEKSKKKKYQSPDHSFGIHLPGLVTYGGVRLDLDDFLVSESDVAAIKRAPTIARGLTLFVNARDEEERRQQLEAEEEKRRDEEDRRRRAERKAREQEEWERRQAEKEREREEYAEFLREQRKRRAAGESMHHHYYEDDQDVDDEYGSDDDEYPFCARRTSTLGRCNCPECKLRDLFGASFAFGGGPGPGGIPFPIFASMFGGMPGSRGFPSGMYDDEEDYDDYDYDENEDDGPEDFFRFFFGGGGRFDDAWDRREEEERRAKTEEQAEILGVPIDADEKTIKTKYRRMALQYHPDKWSTNSAHGLSREDAEDEFKKIQNAYDHLMSNFDDSDEE